MTKALACLDNQVKDKNKACFFSARRSLTLDLFCSNRPMDLLNGCSLLIILKLIYLNLLVTIMYAKEMVLTICGS